MRVIDFCGMMCVSLCLKWQPIKFGCTPLWIAALSDRLKVVQYLLTKAKVNPNQANKVFFKTCGACDCDVMYVWDDGSPQAHLHSLLGDRE